MALLTLLLPSCFMPLSNALFSAGVELNKHEGIVPYHCSTVLLLVPALWIELK